MQCKEWGDANSELFKEPHDEAVHKNSYKSRLCELISASLISAAIRRKYSLPVSFDMPRFSYLEFLLFFIH